MLKVDEMLDRMKEFCSKSIIASFIIGVISFFVVGVWSNIVAGWFIEEYGYSLILIFLMLSIVAILIAGVFVWSIVDSHKMDKLKAEASSEGLSKSYKGLILTLSRISKDDKNKILDRIRADPKSEALFAERGVGMGFRAIRHHSGALEHCWLLCTKEAKDSYDVMYDYIKKNTNNAGIHKIDLEYPEDIETISSAINWIYMDAHRKHLNDSDIIADLTGGTKVISCAMAFACLPPEKNMEYVKQEDKSLIEITTNPNMIIK